MSLPTAEKSLETIRGMAQRNAFRTYIDYVRFPFFRNLEPDTQIDFEFPFTAFVGQNGCGKSSTLQGIYGCPEGFSPATFWFSTDVDPIEERADGERHCIIYSYKKEDNKPISPEVLKRRIKDKNDPELWETSQPIKKYKMDMTDPDTRSQPIKMQPLYMDFRSTLSAFDRAIRGLDAEEAGQKYTRHFVRKRLRYVDIALRGKVRTYQRPIRKEVVEVNNTALGIASEILGRSYLSAKILKHQCFGFWGYTVKYKTKAADYSEAFAGSGEIAVVMLVHQILEAAPSSLILLDEPETSLHPGAQRGLRDFLLEQIVKKKHQVIISTHSPNLIDGLPREAIKVFKSTGAGKFAVIPKINPEEAFFFIGQKIENKRRILVEDTLAQIITNKVLSSLDEATQAMLEVTFTPGGASGLLQDATVYSQQAPSKTHLLLDGDQQKAQNIFNPDDLPIGTRNQPHLAVPALEDHIRKATGSDIEFHHSGASNLEVKIRAMISYLNFLRTNVRYLPFETPEGEIWNAEMARRMIIDANPKEAEAVMSEIDGLAAAKAKFARLTLAVIGVNSAKEIEAVHRQFVVAWFNKNPNHVEALKKSLEAIRDSD